MTVLTAVVAFCLLARWQVRRALSGNTLSWAYAFEWPFFAAYAIYMWWKLLREAPGDSGRVPAPPDPDEELQRAAYNRYLEGLAAEDGRRARRQRA